MTWLAPIGLVLAAIALLLIGRRLVARWDPPGDETTDQGVRRLANGLLYAAAAGLLLVALGVPASALSVIAGGASAGIAFAARDFISDVLAAVSLFVERPFSIGDTITLGEQSGEVRQIGMRATLIAGPGGGRRLSRIPNGLFFRQPLHVQRRSDP